MEAIEGLRFLASLPIAGTGRTERGEKMQPFNCFHSRLFTNIYKQHALYITFIPKVVWYSRCCCPFTYTKQFALKSYTVRPRPYSVISTESDANELSLPSFRKRRLFRTVTTSLVSFNTIHLSVRNCRSFN